MWFTLIPVLVTLPVPPPLNPISGATMFALFSSGEFGTFDIWPPPTKISSFGLMRQPTSPATNDDDLWPSVRPAVISTDSCRGCPPGDGGSAKARPAAAPTHTVTPPAPRVITA